MPFSISIIVYFISVIPLSVKQSLSHAWFLKTHTLGKLMLSIIRLRVKQKLDHVWSRTTYLW